MTGVKTDWAVLFTPTHRQEQTYLYTFLFLTFSIIKKHCSSGPAPSLTKCYAAGFVGTQPLLVQEKEDSPQK